MFHFQKALFIKTCKTRPRGLWHLDQWHPLRSSVARTYDNMHLRPPTGHGYTQIVSNMGFTHGQLQIESETYSLSYTLKHFQLTRHT